MYDQNVAVILTTPEGLCGDGFGARPLRFALHNCGRLARLVVDEAQCVALWGHGQFRPSYRKLGEYAAMLRETALPNFQMLGFSATIPPGCRDDVLQDLGMRNAIVHVGPLDRPEIQFATYPLPVVEKQSFLEICHDAWEQLTLFAPDWALTGRKIVYVNSAKMAMRLAEHLDSRGVASRAFCMKGMTPQER